MKEQDKIREIPEIVVAKSCYVLKDTTECFWGCEHPDDNVFCDNAKEYAANVMRVMELAALIAPTPATDIIADMENPYTEAPRNETEHDLEIRIAMATAWGECQFTALDIIPAAPTPTEPDGVTRGTGELIKDASEVTGIIPEGILKATETGLVELTRDDWIDTVGYVPRPDHDLRKVELKVAKKQLAADQQEIERLNVLLSQANDTAKFWAEYNSDGKWESRIAEAVKAERDWWESHHTGIKYGITDTIYIYKVTKKALEARMGKDKPDLGTARAV